ncbi:hypothetical protein Efla_002894 [Eimeria flavescens]
MSNRCDPCCELHFFVAPACTQSPLVGPCGHSGFAAASSGSDSVSLAESNPSPQDSKPQPEGNLAANPQSDGKRHVASKGSLCAYGDDGRFEDPSVETDASPKNQSDSQSHWSRCLWVRMSLASKKAVPAVLNSSKCAADILKEVWACPGSALEAAQKAEPTWNSEQRSTKSDGANLSGEKLEVLIQELVQIGFASPHQQRLLREAPLGAWAGILPSVTERYCERRFALDVGNHKGADFILWRHQNGLVFVGLAPSHYILEEARRRRKLRRGNNNGAAGRILFSKAKATTRQVTLLRGAADAGNTLLWEDDSKHAKTQALSREPHGVSDYCSGDSVVQCDKLKGPLLKIKLKQEVLGFTATGKRKRGGIQLHVHMKLGTISLEEESCLESPTSQPQKESLGTDNARTHEDGAAGDKAEGNAVHATIFGCITGDMLEMNEALEANADILSAPGWGIFIEKKEALKARPQLLSYADEVRL